MDDKTTRTMPSTNDEVTQDDDRAQSPRQLRREEVARELIEFLSRLSPFRIHPSHTDC